MHMHLMGTHANKYKDSSLWAKAITDYSKACYLDLESNYC